MNNTRSRGCHEHVCPICGVRFKAQLKQIYCSCACAAIHHSIVGGDPEHAHERAMRTIERFVKRNQRKLRAARHLISVENRGTIPGGHTGGALVGTFRRWY